MWKSILLGSASAVALATPVLAAAPTAQSAITAAQEGARPPETASGKDFRALNTIVKPEVAKRRMSDEELAGVYGGRMLDNREQLRAAISKAIIKQYR